MTMSWIYTAFVAVSLLVAILNGRGSLLSAAIAEGARSGVTLSISLAGSICLWTGIGHLMERCGITKLLSAFLRPMLVRLFPEARRDPILQGCISANMCANLLGLGNAATPMGVRAAKRLVDPTRPTVASDSLCRLIVLNTASIQLIPANVAALRASLGSKTPFDILPAVWLTSICAAAVGLCAAWIMGRLTSHG